MAGITVFKSSSEIVAASNQGVIAASVEVFSAYVQAVGAPPDFLYVPMLS